MQSEGKPAQVTSSAGSAVETIPQGKLTKGKKRLRAIREYSMGEEIANSVTHGIGALLSIAAIPIAVVKANADGGGILLCAALFFTIALLIEYTMSTLYHAITAEKAKRVFKVLDHCCIYVLIAGSYSPFCLVSLANDGGLYLFIFVWVVAIVGIACEALWTYRPRWISAVIYLLMGWAVVWFLPTLYVTMPTPAFWLLVAGGISYTVGALFYILKKVPYMHTVFHVFVLAGSITQFIGALYVL